MDGTRTAGLRTGALARFPADQLQHSADRNRRSQRWEVHAAPYRRQPPRDEFPFPAVQRRGTRHLAARVVWNSPHCHHVPSCNKNVERSQVVQTFDYRPLSHRRRRLERRFFLLGLQMDPLPGQVGDERQAW